VSARVAPPRAWRVVFAVLRDTGMAVLALAGVVCLGWLVLSSVLGLSLVTFATGSMAPTIPTGSVAVVREVPASELKVGDVATLERAGMGLPVTHRVTTVEPSPTKPDITIVSMQGDANPIPDVFPYHVSTAKVVLGSLPDAAIVIRTLTNPLALGGLALGISILVIWAFWPRGVRTRPERAPNSTAAASVLPELQTEQDSHSER
jgi:signal peptidase